MNTTEYNELGDWQKVNFRHCRQCDEWYDVRDLSTVLWHHDHMHRPDVQCPRGINQTRLLAVASLLHAMSASGIENEAVEALSREWRDSLPSEAIDQLAAFDRDQLLLLRGLGKGLDAVREMIFDM